MAKSKEDAAAKIIEFSKKLGISKQEAEELLEYDRAIENGEKNLEYDLTAEQEKESKKFSRSAAKDEAAKRTPKPRRENSDKRSIINEVAAALLSREEYCDVVVVNPERTIDFRLAADGTECSINLTFHKKGK